MDSINKVEPYDLTERAKELKTRNKNKVVKQVLALMKRHSITVADLEDFHGLTKEEKFRKQREIVANKLRATESLRKARLARKLKKESNEDE